MLVLGRHIAEEQVSCAIQSYKSCGILEQNTQTISYGLQVLEIQSFFFSVIYYNVSHFAVSMITAL